MSEEKRRSNRPNAVTSPLFYIFSEALHSREERQVSWVLQEYYR